VILVVAEQQNGKLHRASWEAIAAAQQLAAGATPITVAVAGASVAAVARELSQAAVQDVITLEDSSLEIYTPDAFVQALAQLIGQVNPRHVLLPHTYQTRDFAPTLATRLDRALVTDVTAIRGTGDAARFSRPMFQGKLVAEVELSGPAPHFVTIQIGAFRADAAQKGSAAVPVTPATIQIDRAAIRQKPEAPFQEAKQAVDLRQRVVAHGAPDRQLGPDRGPQALRRAGDFRRDSALGWDEGRAYDRGNQQRRRRAHF
jgi:electron transfer flavoprotein alpha subunit